MNKKKSTAGNPMPAKDQELFERMASEYISDNERIFFNTMQERESLTQTICDDLLMREEETPDGLWLVRYYDHEYSLGANNSYTGSVARRGAYVDSLSDVLSVYLDECGLLPRHISLQEWLREKDYEPIHYDRLTEA